MSITKLFKKKPLSFISIHIPKCGGVTWYYILKEIYGDILLQDNTMSPLNPLASKRFYPKSWNNYCVLHGHFDYSKYSHLPLITWIRHPIDRVISHYCYWRFKRKRIKNDFYFKIMKERDLDIYQFAELLPNVITTFVGENPEKFKFIGVLEHFDYCVKKFSKMVGMEIKDYNIRNKNKRIPKGFIQSIDRARIRKFVKKDMEFYEKVLKQWKF